MAMFAILLDILTLPLFFSVIFLNTEFAIQSQFVGIYAIIYILYLVIPGILLLLLNRFKNIDQFKKQTIRSSLQLMRYMAILALPGMLYVHYFMVDNTGASNLFLRSYGRAAFLYLVITLSISPIAVFIKNKKLSDFVVSLRKITGILSFLFFVRHGFEYFSMEYTFAAKHATSSYLSYVANNLNMRMDAFTGVVASIFMIVLGLTSNTFSIKLFGGKTRKSIQSLSYPAFLLSSIHVAFSSRFDVFYTILILWLVYIRTIAYIHQKDVGAKSMKTTKYICIPCGYIYDEALGDPDGGLAPGTKFDDIPDTWVCPVCGVNKLSFQPYYEASSTAATTNESPTPAAPIVQGYDVTVVQSTLLTSNVLELVVKSDIHIENKPGQYVFLTIKDFDGPFSRAYSIVDNVDNTITFGIKLLETGRAGRALRKIKVGDVLHIKNVLGNFVLKDTKNPKVFIATGTGFSPIYNMMLNVPSGVEMTLFWGVRTSADLYYKEKLATLPIKQEIFLSQEENQNYHHGRIQTTTYQFPLETEFYLCGNAPMVKEQMAALKARGYTNIYMEVF